MSALSCYSESPQGGFVSFRSSVTLLQSSSSMSDDGRFIKRSSFQEYVFAEQPYSSICIDEFSVNAISASGAHPSQTFIASNDVDEVIKSVDNLRNVLIPKE